jgi:Bax protein|tara:strand:+ start:170 stop:802 length:633 start_codon:yes stop_codon:yes gene_type:complete
MKNLKTTLTGSLFYIILLIVVFIAGTFYPNFLKVREIEYNLETKYIEEAKQIALFEPEFAYETNEQFISAIKNCINFINLGLHKYERIPTELIIAQAVLESNYGKSRFAKQGNNLFGIRTWNLKEKHIKPFDTNDQTFGIKVFKSKCSCVRYYIKILNNSSAFKEFRKMRKKMLDNNYVNVLSLTQYISKFATDKDYVKKVQRTIKELRK